MKLVTLSAIFVILGTMSSPAQTLASGRTLGDLAQKRGLDFDTFSFTPLNSGDRGFQNAAKEFNLIILPIFFSLVEPEKDHFDFSLADAVADSAPPNAKFFIPQLAWNDQNPIWLGAGHYSGSELKDILIKFISTVVRHFEMKYPGRVAVWEVAIEPLNWKGSARCDDPTKPCGGLWNNIGIEAGTDQYEYIRISAKTVRRLAPKGKLVVTDFGTEDLGERSNQFYQLIAKLKAENIPLDAAAHEGHFMIGTGGPFMNVPSLATLIANLNRLAALGVETMITSVDISIRDVELSPKTLKEQGEGYRTLLKACLSSDHCTTFGTWGVGDSGSWIPRDAGDAFKGWGSPLLFDHDYRKKPAYFALRKELKSKVDHLNKK